MSVFKYTLMLLLMPALALATTDQPPKPSSDLPAYTTPVYASVIDPTRLKPFHAHWVQKQQQDGQEKLSPITIEERLNRNDEGDWVHKQTMHHAEKPIKVYHSRTFDQHSMRLLNQSTHYENAPAQAPKSVTYQLFNNHFTGVVTAADNSTKDIRHPLSMPMFDGQIAGLAIASLPLGTDKKWSMPMTIPTLKAEYWLEAKVTDRTLMAAANGQQVDVWVVDALWHNLTDGDIYPGGPENSGGTYYITADQQAGQPVVMAYANNSALILWDGKKPE